MQCNFAAVATTVLWFAAIVAGTTVRVDRLGVTSIVRALKLRRNLYDSLVSTFHSTGVKLDRLATLFTIFCWFPRRSASRQIRRRSASHYYYADGPLGGMSKTSHS